MRFAVPRPRPGLAGSSRRGSDWLAGDFVGRGLRRVGEVVTLASPEDCRDSTSPFLRLSSEIFAFSFPAAKVRYSLVTRSCWLRLKALSLQPTALSFQKPLSPATRG